jgi:hypothetical protein
MKLENLAIFLEKFQTSDLVVEFDDGDKYPVNALDLQGENDDGEFEICVNFANCLGKSMARVKALETGPRFPSSWWTTGEQPEPVGMQYMLTQIASVYDNDAGYYVFQREQGP